MGFRDDRQPSLHVDTTSCVKTSTQVRTSAGPGSSHTLRELAYVASCLSHRILIGCSLPSCKLLKEWMPLRASTTDYGRSGSLSNNSYAAQPERRSTASRLLGRMVQSSSSHTPHNRGPSSTDIDRACHSSVGPTDRP